MSASRSRPNVVYMLEIPNCNFCDKPACYDAKTKVGPWAYMCQKHFKTMAIGRLGVGFGQKLELRKAGVVLPNGRN